MIRIGIIIGSTRPRRRGKSVADWVAHVAATHPAVSDGRAGLETVDLADIDLPLLAEPVPAIFGTYQQPTTQQWAATIGRLDAFVFVTPEYNHSVPAALKNAIDHLYVEWNDKAAGFVSYGIHGGIRAVEHLRQILAEVRIATVRYQVALSIFTDFDTDDPENPMAALTPAPADHHRQALHDLLDEVIAWASALQQLRHVSAT